MAVFSYKIVILRVVEGLVNEGEKKEFPLDDFGKYVEDFGKFVMKERKCICLDHGVAHVLQFPCDGFYFHVSFLVESCCDWLTVAELRKMCKERKVKYTGLKKEELLRALRVGM